MTAHPVLSEVVLLRVVVVVVIAACVKVLCSTCCVSILSYFHTWFLTRVLPILASSVLQPPFLDRICWALIRGAFYYWHNKNHVSHKRKMRSGDLLYSSNKWSTCGPVCISHVC